MSSPAIKALHMAKRFGGVQALTDVSLSVQEGSIFGFLGPNGAGKTTALRGLVGMIRFDGGDVEVLGCDPWSERVRLAKLVGFLPSSMGMWPSMSGLELLDYTAALSGSCAMRAQVLNSVGLSQADLGRPLGMYSKGMRQKLALTATMQHDPHLLILDEPNEGLDPLVQHEVGLLLQDRAASGKTVLFSSHTLPEVEALCDHVAIIREGQLMISDSLHSLRAKRPRQVRIRPGSVPIHLPESFTHTGHDATGMSVYSTSENVNKIVAALHELDLEDLIIDEPSLEDIFRSYYEGEKP